MNNDILRRRLRDDLWLGIGGALGFWFAGGTPWWGGLAFGVAAGMFCATISLVTTVAM